MTGSPGADGRPAPQPAVVAALFVDLENVRARYECMRCRTGEGPVYGAEVAAFVATVRIAHPTRCTALRETRT